MTDVPFKTHVSPYLSLGLNLLFAAMNLFFGAYYGSVWYGTLAVYYILLAVMRFLLLRHVSRNVIGAELILELRRYRLCGVILLLMNIALSGVVALVISKNEGFRYAGYLIYVVAMYAFYNVIIAVRDLIKYHRYQSPVMSASKAIKLAAALVSMLSLETAMLAQFDTGGHSPIFTKTMNTATGGGICLIVLVMAISMIVISTRQLKRLGSVEVLKTDFFSNVPHEIKTPLAVIQNNAELLQNEHLTNEQRGEYTKTILHATRRLSNLIMNMLRLNKLEKQAINPMPRRFDLCAQLSECALQFENSWEEKHIEFVAELEDRAYISDDEELLALVWTNLLSNAIKFTPAGGTVTLTLASGADWTTVTVSDTGCGMNEETVQRIFDKFYQGDTSHATEGNGLGLSLVRRILELSDGTITVESAADRGSVFTVRLPSSQDREERAQ